MKPLIILDAGHGGSDGGASANGIIEKEFTLKVTLYQYERFKELNIPVALTRSKDETLDWKPRTTRVKASGAAHCISNHFNAGGGAGAEIIHSIFDKNSAFPSLAMNELIKVGMKERRIFSRKNSSGSDWYYMHRETGAVKTYIVEYGFVDNKQDAEKIKKDWKELAEAVVKAYCEFVDHSYFPPEGKKENANLGDYPKNIEEWKKEAVEWLFDQKLLTSNYWKRNINNPLPLWALALVLQRIVEQNKK